MVELDRVFQIEQYVEEVLKAKDRGLPVLLGLEIDFIPGTEEAVAELLSPYPWDFLLGAVHWVGSWAIDTSECAEEFERRGVEESWEQYFGLVVEMIQSGMADVLAHVDVCKKYGYRPPQEPLGLYTTGCGGRGCPRGGGGGVQPGSAQPGRRGLSFAGFFEDVPSGRNIDHSGQ